MISLKGADRVIFFTPKRLVKILLEVVYRRAAESAEKGGDEDDVISRSARWAALL
jgi:hypothetical protein